MIAQTLTPFDITKQAIEGLKTFRANASYSWSWLIEHTNQQNVLIEQINSTVSEMSTLAQSVTTKAQQVSDDKAIVNQAKLDAQAARDAAIVAKNAAETIYDNFDDRYLGTKTTVPTTDNDGDPLRAGNLYFNSTTNKMYVYNSQNSTWIDLSFVPTLLSSLTDILLTTKSNGDVLTFNSVLQKWENKPLSLPALTGAISNILENDLTALRVLITDINGKITVSSLSLTTLNYLGNVTSDIQTQLNSKQATLVSESNLKSLNGISLLGSGTLNIEDRLGSVLPSAATTTIGTSGLGDYFHISGTTTITSFGAATTAGIRRTLCFDGILTITHHATNLICPGTTNIVTAAGTVIELIAETTSTWRVVSISNPLISMAELGYLDGVTSSIQTQINNRVDKSGAVLTGALTAIRETKVAMAANNIDLATGNLFTKTISAATTFTVSNILATGNANSFILELTNAGSQIITWWTGVKWAGGIAPTLTTAGVDIIGFYTHDGGTTWRGILMSKDSK